MDRRCDFLSPDAGHGAARDTNGTIASDLPGGVGLRRDEGPQVMRIIIIVLLICWLLWSCAVQNRTQTELDAAHCALNTLAYFDKLPVERMDFCYSTRGLKSPWYEE
jgi:hypothetical protein